MSEIRRLFNSRKYLRKCITEQHNRRGNFAALSSSEREKLKLTFEQWSIDLKDYNKQILANRYLEWTAEEEEEKSEAEFKVCHEYDDKLLDCVVALTASGVVSVNSNQVDDESRNSARSLLRSPIAPLPKYSSSDTEDLVRFFEEFEDTISKFSYPEYDKLLLLKQQISGRALVLVNSLEADKQGYTFAKKLLLKALASEDTQKFNVIRQLSKLNLDYSTDPYDFISKVRLIIERVRKLNVNVDEILRYFIWEGMNEHFKNQLVQITNNAKPSLDEITDKFFEATERYLGQQKQAKISRKQGFKEVYSVNTDATGLAIDVHYNKSKNFKPCSLCSKQDNKEANHPIFKCPVFVSAKSKVDKLNHFNGCIKCSNLNHDSKKCRYKFNARCKHCSEWHFSFLCLRTSESKARQTDKRGNSPIKTSSVSKPDSNNSTLKVDSKSNKQEISGCMVKITDVFQSHLDIESILPTFCCEFESKLKVRCLKDSGCQCNFIVNSIADELGLKTVRDNICLDIKGINITRQYNTRLVEATINLGGRSRVVNALCIPSIDISLKLPCLGKVVEGFKDRGYLLADEYLHNDDNVIDGIGFILGTKSSYCLPQNEQVFGPEGLSLFSQTIAGVLLHGNIEQILKDLPYLPYANACFSGSIRLSDNNLLDNVLASKKNNLSLDRSLEDSLNALEPLNFSILDKTDSIVESQIEKAANEIIKDNYFGFSNRDHLEDEEVVEINVKLVRYALENMRRNEEGRIIVPLLWNSKVSHLLGTNQELARAILNSNLKKLLTDRSRLLLMDQVFKDQEKDGIIERIDDLDKFLIDHPSHSFMPHTGVFKLGRETTKCRVVYLSNLCQKNLNGNVSVSHNQAIYPGPNLNQKITSALLHLRFGSHILCFDICKAFNNLALDDIDSNRLLCLWYKNVEKDDFTVVAYRNMRLSFGLRCSPALLLLALYKILILDNENCDNGIVELKKLIYQLCYMDNCAVACDSSQDLEWSYKQLKGIFEPYRFYLQQYVTNDDCLQELIDFEYGVQTSEEVKLLGLVWNRTEDSLSTRPISLDMKANTKRAILSTVASQFDLYNFNGPLLNRSRLFLHELQCNKTLDWDTVLDKDLQRQWQNIVKQANAAPVIKVPRFVGSRNDSYKLIAFSDSSKIIMGVVVYIQSMTTGKVSFVIAKNRIVSGQMSTKSIPSLELQGIALAVECLLDLYDELSGNNCVNPINIIDLQVYSDSLVALSWINSYSIKLDKLQKCSVFVKNRLLDIDRLCERHKVMFKFVSGEENPADCITRSMSYKQLVRSNYFTGPNVLFSQSSVELSMDNTLVFVVPDPGLLKSNSTGVVQSFKALTSYKEAENEHLHVLSRVSSFHRLVKIYSRVLVFVNNLKRKMKIKCPTTFAKFNVFQDNHNFFAEASKLLLQRDQRKNFPEIFEYFSSDHRLLKDIPKLVSQLNIYVDGEGLLRVRSKLSRLKDEKRMRFPILLSKDSSLTRLIILDYHERFSHAGCYSLLSELRKTFWIPKYFSAVKKVLKTCVLCRRLNERTINLNQNSYRNFRVNPPEIPFRYVFLDYFGPYFVKSNGSKHKVWILCITCTWSRAINLKLCIDMSVKEFLRAIQLHCYDYGVPEFCMSDMGSQLVAGANIISDFLKDPEIKLYLNENGIKSVKFEHYFKGNSALGSMVESCVKLTKRLIFGSIKNNVLDIRDFEFLIHKTNHLVNRRPIAFKESLRETNLKENFPEAITPESLIKGYDLVSINIIPDLQPADMESDPDFSIEPVERIKNTYSKLRKVRSNLMDIYHSEFLATLIQQAVSKKDRYKPVPHKALQKNDIVLIKEPYSKPSNYPMAIVREVVHNDLGEVTGVTLCKGKTKEITKRHVSNLIFLLRPQENTSSEQEENNFDENPVIVDPPDRPVRRAGKICKYRNQVLFNET